MSDNTSGWKCTESEKTQWDIPPSYFEDEVRDGFLIPGMMKRLWAVNLQTYHCLESVCRELGISCSVFWGTLIGTIRHGGYIPWDDDIDVEMKRDEYMSLEKAADMNKLPGECWINDYRFTESDNMTRCFMTSRSLVEPYEKWKDNYGFPFVGIIDIFLQDFIPIDEADSKEYWAVIERAGALKERIKTRDKSRLDMEFEQELKAVAAELGATFDKKSKTPLLVQVLQAMDAYCLKYSEEREDPIGILAYYRWNPKRIIPRNLYAHCFDARFEYGTIRVPVGYDGILRRYYGNPMTPALYSDAHSYPVYAHMEEDARRVTGFEFTKYHPDASLIEELHEKRVEHPPMRKELEASLAMLSDAHGYIRSVFMAESETDGIPELLMQCQELAIGMGERIEAKAREPEPVVRILENYCESIFHLYETLATGSGEGESVDDRYTSCDELEMWETRLRDSISMIEEKKAIVFLCHKSENWKAFHSLWEELTRAGDCEVTVIAVPYYYKDYEQKIDREQMIIDTENYPKEVLLTPYDGYDFEKNHPDAILYQFPYDEYNSAVSVHPYYYTSNLYPYTEMMVLIPPFILREVSAGEQIRHSLRTYLETPGGVLADLIYAQSDEMREAYWQILTEFTGEGVSCSGSGKGEPESHDSNVLPAKPSGKWGSRILATGLPLYDWTERRRIVICEEETGTLYTRELVVTEPSAYDDEITLRSEWINKLRNVKILIYTLSASMVYEHGKQAVKDADELLTKIENECKNLCVLWCEDENASAILETYEPDLWKAYTALIEKWKACESVVYIPVSYEERIGLIADGMYGDMGTVMYGCIQEKKPVYLEQPEAEAEEKENAMVFIREIAGSVPDTGDETTGDTQTVVGENDQGTTKAKTEFKVSSEKRINPICSARIRRDLLGIPVRQVAVICEISETEKGEAIAQSIRATGGYEVCLCPLDEEKTIQAFYAGWSRVPDMVLTVNLAGFSWRSSGSNSMYATLAVNTLHYIDRDVTGEERLLSGLIPITMTFVTDTKERYERLKNTYRRIHDIHCTDNVTGEIGLIVDKTEWRQ